MKLFAIKTTSRNQIRVYDDSGKAFIVREGSNPASWHSERTAENWVSIQIQKGWSRV